MRATSADSAGTPWSGRRFSANSFSDDDGAAPDALIDAITALRSVAEGGEEWVVDAVRTSRLLIPLLAHRGEVVQRPDGSVVEKSQELGVSLVAARDGRVVWPVFSSTAAMRSWNSAARPVPADGTRVALAAVAEGADIIVIDPGSETECALRRPAVWAVARSEQWTPSYRDPDVANAFASSIHNEPDVVAVQLTRGDPTWRLVGPELHVSLELAHGLSADQVDAVVTRLTHTWAVNSVIAARVDSLGVSIHSRGETR